MLIAVKGGSFVVLPLRYHEQTIRMHNETVVPLSTDDVTTAAMDAADIVVRGSKIMDCRRSCSGDSVQTDGLVGGVVVSEFVSAVPPPECTTPFLVNEYDDKNDNNGNDC